MKKFEQFVEESTKPGTFAHFNHHAKMWDKHVTKACRIEDKPFSHEDSSVHWDKADEHESELMKHYGKRTVRHALDGNDVSTATGRREAWADLKKKRGETK